MKIVAIAWWETDTRLVFELHTENEKLSGGELTYVSTVGAWLKEVFRNKEIIVNGMKSHPILYMSYLNPDTVKALQQYGY